MPKQMKWKLLFFFLMFALPALACSPGGIGLPDVNVPEGAAATAEGMAREAATAVARVTIPPGARETAVAFGAVAATRVADASAEGGQALSTLQATDFDVDVTVDADQLQDKIADAQPDENGNITITVTDDEINQAVEIREISGGSDLPATFRDPSVAFTGGNVILTGQMTQPLQAELVAEFQPLIVDGQVQVELQRATVQGLPVPTQALAPVEQNLNNALREMTATLPQNYVVQEINMGEGTMTIIAVRSG